MSYAALEMKVIRWASDRGIIQHSNIEAQAIKTLEEANELVEAATAIRAAGADPARSGPLQEAYRDALGDVLVTIIVGAATADVDLVECLEQAYNEIKERKGFLKPDGTFVKVVQ